MLLPPLSAFNKPLRLAARLAPCRALSNVADEGLLTEGFFWIPSLAGPTKLNVRGRSGRGAEGAAQRGRAAGAAQSSEGGAARRGRRCGAS